jgi:hypothetical protein
MADSGVPAGTITAGEPEVRAIVGPLGLSLEVPAGGLDLEPLGIAEDVG